MISPYGNSPTTMPAMSPGLSLSARLSTAIRRPFSQQKCIELTQLIREGISCRSKDLQSIFGPLLENIFGISQNAYDCGDWNLKTINRLQNPTEYELLMVFLRPDGILFELIRHLTCESSFVCDLPVAFLPLPTQRMFEDGITPAFYANKIDMMRQNNVCLTPLEFYLFLFFYYIQSTTRTNMRPLTDQNPSNLAYVSILESYMKYFLPLDHDQNGNKGSIVQDASLHKIWSTLSSTTSNILHGNMSSAHNHSGSTSTPKSSLLNAKFLSAASTPQNNFSSLGVDILGSEVGKAEIFLNTFTEMLLNVNIPPQLVGKKKQSPMMETTALPNVDHVRGVRIFVKHVHFFANTALFNESSVNPQIHVSNTTMNELKQNIWTSRYQVQSKLYGFLKLCFETWPSDASLRMPLETWLSYIQPWRYVSSKDMAAQDDDAPSDQFIDPKWKPFIVENLLFYSVLFRQVLVRLKRLDLFPSKNSLMLHRVVKVFSQNNVKRLVLEAEKNALNSIHSRTPLFSPPKSRSSTALSPTLGISSHLLEYEEGNFVYTSLFSEDMQALAKEIVQTLKMTESELSSLVQQASNSQQVPKKNQSFLNSVKVFFVGENEPEVDDQVNVSEYKKSENFIQQSISKLQTLFEFSLQNFDDTLADTTDYSGFRNRHQLTPTKLPRAETTPPDFRTPSRLTERGRQQVMSRLGKADVHFEGNPDLQPTRTYEVGSVLPFLQWISDMLNLKYGPAIQKLYDQRSIKGSLVRALVAPPVSFTQVVKRGPARLPERIQHHSPPRIHLRFLGNQLVLAASIGLLSYCFLFGFKTPTLLITLSVLFMLFLTKRVVSEKMAN
ncbi:Sphingomyelin phosphodiesterase 4 [Halotydeus destructor]|nr:Sphingomyelin phosphodiesterase 4 [Halotydeus destructor]